jgi:hypothetical protein
MKDQDVIERQEAASGEVIAALGRLSEDVQASPDFVARVLAKADQQPVRRPMRVTWLGRLPWGVDVAVAAVLILAVVGAVPQYLTWFHTYVRGVPAEQKEPFEPLRTRGHGGGMSAPSLPLGTWEVNASGDRGPLQLASVSRQGELRGTLFGNEIVGFWDELAEKVMFVRIMNPAVPSTVQLFTGYLFRNPGGSAGWARQPTPSPARLRPWPARALRLHGRSTAGMRNGVLQSDVTEDSAR